MTHESLSTFYERRVELLLSMTIADEQRRSLLSSPQRCLQTATQGDTEWDVLYALCTHLGETWPGGEVSRIDWRVAYGPVLVAVKETSNVRPIFASVRRMNRLPSTLG